MDELSKAFPAAEGMVEAEQSGKSHRHNDHCLNCGTLLIDDYCHHCGQKDIPKRQTLGELLSNFISSFWSYEGKFLRTAQYLITRPGFLAKEYNAGRRESYYHPARMYVFISFVFFLLFFSLSDADEPSNLIKVSGDKEGKGANIQHVDSVMNAISSNDSTLNTVLPGLGDSIKSAVEKKRNNGDGKIKLSPSDYDSVREYDSAQQALPEGKRDGWLTRKFTIRGIELNQKYKGNMQGFAKDFGKAFMENFSKILFFLLPVFALILKLLYIRRDYFYSEHLVFSIYYYNFFYLAGSFFMAFNLFPSLDWVATIIGFWIFVYLLVAMKRMYGQSWRKTIFKYFIFLFLFFVFALVGMSVNALFILLMI